MTALADTLRERASRRGQTAQVDCGALGMLTVEALPAGECSALAAERGERGLLYAACRELQEAGEALRREGLVFTPDEIMEYVFDREVKSAAETILHLSGGDAAAEKSEAEPDSSGPSSSSEYSTEAASEAASAGQNTPEDAGDAPAETVDMPAPPLTPDRIAETEVPVSATVRQADTEESSHADFGDSRQIPVQEGPGTTPSTHPAPPPAFEREPSSFWKMTAAERPTPADNAEEPAPSADTAAARESLSYGEDFGVTEASGRAAPVSPSWPKEARNTPRAPEPGRSGAPPEDCSPAGDNAPCGTDTGGDPPPRGSGRIPKEPSALPGGDSRMCSQSELPAETGKLLPGRAESPAGLWEIPREFPQDSGIPMHKPESVLPETPHVFLPEIAAADDAAAHSGPEAAERAVCEITPEAAEQVAWHLLEGLRQAASVR